MRTVNRDTQWAGYEQWLPLVEKIARKYARWGGRIEFDDLYQVGCEGLLAGLRRINGGQNVENEEAYLYLFINGHILKSIKRLPNDYSLDYPITLTMTLGDRVAVAPSPEQPKQYPDLYRAVEKLPPFLRRTAMFYLGHNPDAPNPSATKSKMVRRLRAALGGGGTV